MANEIIATTSMGATGSSDYKKTMCSKLLIELECWLKHD